jgi:hypothetical protein
VRWRMRPGGAMASRNPRPGRSAKECTARSRATPGRRGTGNQSLSAGNAPHPRPVCRSWLQSGLIALMAFCDNRNRSA